MDVRIDKAELFGSVSAISSKSAAHRLLICAALSDKSTRVICSQSSDDIEATVSCLRGLGADISCGLGEYIVSPIVSASHGAELNCFESGSTLRFILPVISALGAECTVKMSGRLPYRPLSPFYEELVNHGAVISGVGTDTLTCSGQLMPGEYTLPGNISSQFISGLLFALPQLCGDSMINVTDTLESRPYIDLTLSALDEFGLAIECSADRFFVPGARGFSSCGEVRVPGDWSNAAFWLCAGALGAGVTCTGLDLGSRQGDMAVLTALERFGAQITCETDSVSVSRGTLRGTEIDARDCPDLVPVLAAVASGCEGETVIYNAGRLRIKESDRLQTTAQTLTALGAQIRQSEDGLIIRGKRELQGGTVSSHGDHRIVMMSAIAAMLCREPVVITGANATSKSYPGFFEDYRKLGGTLAEVL